MDKYYSNKNRFQIMSYDKVVRLTNMLSNSLEIFTNDEVVRNPNLCLKNIIPEMRRSLKDENIQVEEIRLIGGAVAHIIDPSSNIYSDLDILFCLPCCSSLAEMDSVRRAVQAALSKLCSSTATSGECCPTALITKQVCIQAAPSQYWSLFSLGNPQGDMVELKFVNNRHQRVHFECSIDSFQIVLDPVLAFMERHGLPSKSFYPLCTVECTWGCVKTALQHLKCRLVHIDRPERVRGGGLLKFCKLLTNSFRLHPDLKEQSIKKLMCSRFFIDFPLLAEQHQKIINYLYYHFPKDSQLYVEFLNHLSEVILSSANYIEVDKLQLGLLLRYIAEDIRQCALSAAASSSSSSISSCDSGISSSNTSCTSSSSISSSSISNSSIKSNSSNCSRNRNNKDKFTERGGGTEWFGNRYRNKGCEGNSIIIKTKTVRKKCATSGNQTDNINCKISPKSLSPCCPVSSDSPLSPQCQSDVAGNNEHNQLSNRKLTENELPNNIVRLCEFDNQRKWSVAEIYRSYSPYSADVSSTSSSSSSSADINNTTESFNKLNDSDIECYTLDSVSNRDSKSSNNNKTFRQCYSPCFSSVLIGKQNSCSSSISTHSDGLSESENFMEDCCTPLDL